MRREGKEEEGGERGKGDKSVCGWEEWVEWVEWGEANEGKVKWEGGGENDEEGRGRKNGGG